MNILKLIVLVILMHVYTGVSAQGTEKELIEAAIKLKMMGKMMRR
jgi:hypothetical protein